MDHHHYQVLSSLIANQNYRILARRGSSRREPPSERTLWRKHQLLGTSNRPVSLGMHTYRTGNLDRTAPDRRADGKLS